MALPVLALFTGCRSGTAHTSNGVDVAVPDTPLGRQLARGRLAARLPAVAGVRVTVDESVQAHAFGVRRASDSALVGDLDHFHLGSNTKAITATLIGALVDDGVLPWDRTLAQGFPEFASTMLPAWRTVTLRQLLTHRAGLGPFTSPEEVLGLPESTRRGSPAEQRMALAGWLLQRQPAGPVGAFEYSNAGYGLAAAMAERAAGAPWERLLQERLFTPLGIPASAVRIGWPGLAGDAPWGHIEDGRNWEPHTPTDDRLIAIPPALAPAGDLSMTMDAYGRFLQLHVRGLAGRDGVLRAATVRTLHEPDGDYALGWGVQREARGAVHFHEGSAGTFHAVTLLDPTRGVAVATVTNAGGDRAADAIRDAAVAVLRP